MKETKKLSRKIDKYILPIAIIFTLLAMLVFLEDLTRTLLAAIYYKSYDYGTIIIDFLIIISLLYLMLRSLIFK